MNLKLGVSDFEEILGSSISAEGQKFIQETNFQFEKANGEQINAGYIKFINFLLDYKQESGPEYHSIWEQGWQENLNSYVRSGDLIDLIPKFVRKKELIRFDGGWISPESPEFETNFVMVLRDTIFRANFIDASSIWEFGSGTGLNLVHLSKILPGRELFGCDWAMPSVQILRELNQKLNLNIRGFHFDLFQPEYSILKDIKTNSGLFTIGTMEQLGQNYQPFLDFVLASNFKRIVHIETNYEIYDDSNLLDFLAKKYIEKRNWLRGYFSTLHRLEQAGKIRIHMEKRTFGSFFHDGYTITTWEKLNV